MKYKQFPAQFFNHFIEPCPPAIAELKSIKIKITWCLEGSTSPIKMVPSLCGLPPIY